MSSKARLTSSLISKMTKPFKINTLDSYLSDAQPPYLSL